MKAQLILNVDVKPNGIAFEQLKSQLSAMAGWAVQNGLITGDLAAELNNASVYVREGNRPVGRPYGTTALVEALKACLACLKMDSDSERDYALEIAKAQVAIAKVEGQQ